MLETDASLLSPEHAAPSATTRSAPPGAPRPGAAARDRTAVLARVNGPLVAILLLALGLRLWGIDWQLPWLLHPQERLYVQRASAILLKGDLNPHFFFNPSFLMYWLAAQYWLLGQIGTALGMLRQPLELLRGPDLYLVHLVDRLNSAAFGSATVLAVYALGVALLNRAVGLLAAAYLAVNYLHARNSHFGTNDVEAAFFVVLTVYVLLRLVQRPTLRFYVLAGVCGGLATGTKYNAGLYLAPFLAAHALAWRRQVLAPAALRLLVVGGLASAAGYLATTPYTLLAWPEFLDDFLEQIEIASTPHLGQSGTPVPLLYALTLLQALGVVQVLLAIVGVVALALARARWSAALAAGVFPLVYLAYMAPKEVFWIRLVVPLVPFFCLFAAAGTWMLVSRYLAGRRQMLALLVLAAVAALQPAAANVRHNLLATREDTRVQASRWVVEHLGGQEKIAAEDYSLSWPGDWPAAAPQVDGYERLHARELDFYRRKGYRYLITSSFIQDRYALPTTELWAKRLAETRDLQWPEEGERSKELEARLVPLVTFAPGVGGSDVPFDLDDIHTPFWNLDAWERPGPTIRIYALD